MESGRSGQGGGGGSRRRRDVARQARIKASLCRLPMIACPVGVKGYEVRIENVFWVVAVQLNGRLLVYSASIR